MKRIDQQGYMSRCLDLARRGIGRVSPNPAVGCVLVRKGKIVGEGFHAQFGGAHAEVSALIQAGKKARGAVMFVSLEPCAHVGKTPPCTDAIIHAGITEVIIAAKDPNPLVSGKGIRCLRSAGVKVEVGLLRQEAETVNEKFFTWMKTGIPFVGLKLAQTLDGKIADRTSKSKWITSDASRKIVHQLRSEYDAVMAGATTVAKDDPELTVRQGKGRIPVRIIVDGRFTVPVSRKIFKTKAAPTWIFTSSSALKLKKRKARILAAQGVRIIPVSRGPSLHPESILKILSMEGVSSVLIEGGAALAGAFIKDAHVKKLHLFLAPKILGGGLDGMQFTPSLPVGRPIQLKDVEIKKINNDIFIEARFL